MITPRGYRDEMSDEEVVAAYVAMGFSERDARANLAAMRYPLEPVDDRPAPPDDDFPIRLPDGRLRVPHAVQGPNGTVGDMLVDVGPGDPLYEKWLPWVDGGRPAPPTSDPS